LARHIRHSNLVLVPSSSRHRLPVNFHQRLGARQ